MLRTKVRKYLRENFRPNWPKPLIVEDHDDARGRRRAGPGRQHRLAVRVAALLTRPGLQAVEPAAKAVATTTREPCTAGGELALAASTALP